MDSGFKRFWSRKKSGGAADQPLYQRKLQSSNGIQEKPQANMSAVRDGRPSITTSRSQLEQPFSKEKSDGLKELTSGISNDEFGRSKSSHRIQPMLVGISRPDTGIGRDRPDTAGSFQSAVQRAADSVGPRTTDATLNQPTPIKSAPISKPVSRHVDIFAVAASVPSSRSRYNEEIAERNLDTLRLALEHTPYVYNPSSRYQEEVAIRNAYLPYKTRTSSDTLPRITDADRSASATGRSLRTHASPQPNGSTSYQTPLSPASPLRSTSEPYQSNHSRQISQRSRDGSQLQSIPQEFTDADDYFQSNELKSVSQTPYSPDRTPGAVTSSRYNQRQMVSEGQPYTEQPMTADTSTTPRTSGQSSNYAIPDYKVSLAEYNNHTTAANSILTGRIPGLLVSTNAMLGPPSIQSNASSSRMAIMRSNRTFLDLTNEEYEFISDTSSALYSNYSPVIEQAKSDAFQKIEPYEIHTEERRGSKGPHVLEKIIAAAPPTQKIVTAPPSTYVVTTRVPPASILYATDQFETEDDVTPTTAKPDPLGLMRQHMSSSSSFSPISTVASWSPRSSGYVMKSVEPLSMTARVAAALETSRAIARENPLPSSTRMTTESPTVRERVATFESSADLNASSGIVSVDIGGNGSMTKVTSLSQGRVKSATQATESLASEQPVVSSSQTSVEVTTDATNPLSFEQLAAFSSQTPLKATTQPLISESTHTPVAKPTSAIPHTPSIYTSPDSITSVDYINPSNTFGVRTRDFAVSPLQSARSPKITISNETPTKSALSPVVSKSQSQVKSVKPGPRRKTPTSRKIPVKSKPVDTGFDEEAFARKQADARAALDRLQRSLSEDFLTLPDRATLKSSSTKISDVENRQSAPTLILPNESKVTVPVLKRAETERVPPSSFRTARDTVSVLAPNSRSLSAGSRSARRAPAPSSLKNVEPATNPIDQNMLSPALLHAIQFSSQPPKSPGEISLSSFPVPSSSRPNSQPDAPIAYHSHSNSVVGMMKRRNSNKSQGSTTSVFSIPLHMVPGRTSSVRDPVPEEVDPALG